MVHKNDGTKDARPPQLEDLVNLCKNLNNRGAKYIVIGGMAMLQQGMIRATEDIDLLIEINKKNERAVIDAVAQLPDQAALELEPGDIGNYEVIRVADEIVVDLMAKAGGITYENASKKIQLVKINKVTIPFANIDLLIEMKQTARPKDQVDMAFLTEKKKNLK